jgi:hypothetical protein
MPARDQAKRIKFIDRYEVKIKPKVAAKLSERGREALQSRLQSHAGKYSLAHFRTKARAADWLASLPEGLRTRCEVSPVAYFIF